MHHHIAQQVVEVGDGLVVNTNDDVAAVLRARINRLQTGLVAGTAVDNLAEEDAALLGIQVQLGGRLAVQ